MVTKNEIIAALREHDNFLILTHTRPDGDTLCSAGALCSALRRTGKTAALYPNPEITENFEEMTSAYLAAEVFENAFVVSVDVAAENMFPVGFEGKADLCIDHHFSNSGFAPITFVNGDKASCGEIVMELIETMCGGLTKEEADLLYVAVSTDCGCFVYANTKPETLRAAAKLVEYGAENARLNKRFLRSFSFARLKLEGMIYASLRSERDNKINIAVITLKMMEESGATENDCDDLASLAGKVRGNVVAITIRELPDGRSKASVRTNHLVDASAVCAKFGGGGHAMAAGCTVDAGPDTLAEKLLQAVNEIWPE